MAKVYPYKSLDDVLHQIKSQALKDVKYMKARLPYRSLPDLFLYLKSVTSYKNDPKQIELIHRPKSLFENNYHGKPGAGDCDCFTTLGIASLLAAGYKPSEIFITLVGREKTKPRHIYLYVDTTAFDLTNSMLGIERKYPFRQFINLNKI